MKSIEIDKSILFATIILIELLSIVNTQAQEQTPAPVDLDDFITFYYLKPEPDKAPEMLINFLQSEPFKKYDKHYKNSMAYFFARIGQSEPSLATTCLSLLSKAHTKKGF